MKLKFKFMAILAALGIVSTGFAAWNFATPTEGDASVNVTIEGYTAIGEIELDPIGVYNLASTPNALSFTARYLEGTGGVPVSELNLTYKVTLGGGLEELITFGSVTEGVWVSDVATSITPTWIVGKNPTNSEQYNAIKANVEKYTMNVSLTATKKTGLEPVAPDTVVPGTLPAGLVENGGVLEYDKELGALQFSVVGLNEGGTQEGVVQNFTWSTSDATRATVADGLVTPHADGDVTITATAQSMSGKGLKKADGAAAKYEFNLRITGFTVIPPDPVATSLRLVLGAGVEEFMELEIEQEISIRAEVLDEKGNLMDGLLPIGTVSDSKTATYNNGILKAIAEDEVATLTFSYEDLKEIEFYFTIKPAEVAKPLYVVINGGLGGLDLKFGDADGTLTGVVFDTNEQPMVGETVVWSTPNNSVIYINPTTGAYQIKGSGTVIVTAKSTTNEYAIGTILVTVAEPVIIEHTVKLVYGHDIPDSSVTVVHGEAIGTLTAPEVAGYTFLRWENNNTEFLLNTPIVSDGLILTAIYTKITYSVSFDLDGGNGSYDTQQVDPGQFATNPGTPSRTGYTFSGWFNGATLFDFENTQINSALNLKAHWAPLQYTVTFVIGEGASMSDPVTVDVNHGETVSKPNDPILTGYIFKGWQLNGVNYDFASEVTGDLTLNADWDEDSVPVISDYEFDFTLNGLSSDSTALTQSALANTIVSNNAEEITFSYSGAAYGGPVGLRFGSGSNPGSITITTTETVYALEIVAKKYSDKDNNNIKVNGMSAGITTDFESNEVELDDPAKQITIASFNATGGGCRFFVESLTLYTTPPVPPAELDSIVVSSASGEAVVVEKQTLQLSALVKDIDGNDVNNAQLVWESLNEEIAEIDANGLLKAIAPGNVIIKVTATRKTSVKFVEYAVQVEPRATAFADKIVLSGYESGTNLVKSVRLDDANFTLVAKVFNQYEEIMPDAEVVWSSSSPNVATVNNGVVSIENVGDTKIKAVLANDDRVSVTLVLTVNPIPVGGTATYAISSKNTLSKSGVAPEGSSATLVETYSTSKQMTKDNSQTVTLSNYGNVKITKITVSMKSNGSDGAGNFTYSLDGGTTWISIVSTNAFNNAAWNGKYTTTYTDIVKSVNITVTNSVIFKISCTKNSLYAESYAFQWE